MSDLKMKWKILTKCQCVCKDEFGQNIKDARGRLQLEDWLPGAIKDLTAAAGTELVSLGYALPADEAAHAACAAEGLTKKVIKAQIQSRKLLETTDVVAEVEGESLELRA